MASSVRRAAHPHHALLVLAAVLAATALAEWRNGGLVLEVEAVAEDGGTWNARTRVHDVEPRDVLRLRPPQAVSSRARWSGILYVPRAGDRTLRLRAQGTARLLVDGTLGLEASGDERRHEVRLPLSEGAHRLELTWEAPGSARQIVLREVLEDGAESLPAGALFQASPSWPMRRLHAVLAGLGATPAGLLGTAALLMAAGLVVRRRRVPGPPLLATLRGRPGRLLMASLAGLAVVYAAALRFECLTDSFWDTREWRWAEPLRPVLVELKPDSMHWSARVPFKGGDPYAYLRYGRTLRDFYEERVREPLFVYATHLGLLVTHDNDAGVGVASASFSTLIVLALYLLGAEAFSRGAGLIAAVAFAIERDAIWWGVQGWRDDAFAFFVVLFAWAVLRFQARARFSDALLLALAGGGAWLTRITSLTFLVPSFVVLALLRGGEPSRRRRLERLAVAALLVAALMAPFLLNCWVALGDPLYAINEYTAFFRERSGHQDAQPLTAAEYVLSFKPFEMADKAFIGSTWHPFAEKWNYEDWWPPLGRVLATASLAGLFLFAFLPAGRLLLLVHLSAMLPFLWGWDVVGGSPWRHTLHAYPFYLVAAGFVLDGAVRLASSAAARASARAWLTRRRVVALGAGALGLAVAVPVLAYGLRYGRVAEGIRSGSVQLVQAGPRDALFFDGAWHAPRHVWNWYARFLGGREGTIALPLAAGQAYRLTLRMDPFLDAPDEPLEVAVRLNDVALASLTLDYDPEHTGEYVVDVPAGLAVDGRNPLRLTASRVDSAGSLSERPADIPEDWKASLELRYVRVAPDDT